MRLPLTALVSGLAFANGCVKQDAAMFIEGALPLKAPACIVSATDTVFQSSGTLDLLAAAGSGYASFLKVRTNLPATFNNTDVSQDQTRSPNYPDYGPVDNNVVIFESAAIDLALQSDKASLLAFGNAAAATEQETGLRFTCGGGECSTNPNGDPAAREIVPAAGTAFNIQTTLNSPQVIVTEALSGNTASILLNTFIEAAKLHGAVDGDGKINAVVAQEVNLLVVPGQRQRVQTNISLTGTTTGSGDLRPVTSFDFPFGIDVCIGCLRPDAAFCEKVDAVVLGLVEGGAAATPIEGCIASQDIQTAVCGCVRADGTPDGRIVTNDADICRPRP